MYKAWYFSKHLKLRQTGDTKEVRSIHWTIKPPSGYLQSYRNPERTSERLFEGRVHQFSMKVDCIGRVLQASAGCGKT